MTRRQFFTLLATILGSGIVILDGTVVNLALPSIARNLHASFADLQWIVDGYLLSLSALMLLGGSLGDVLGRKRIYTIGLAGFGIASLVCGLAPTSAFLIGMRVIQGVFGALLVPGGLAIINTNFEPGQRGKVIGQWSAWSALAAAIGPLLGGVIVDAISWRWIFFINVPLVAICFVLAQAGVVETRDTEPRRLDIPGSWLTVIGLGGLTFGLIEGPVTHWGVVALLSLGVGVLALLGFILVEGRRQDPMVQFSLFRSRNFTGSNLMTFMMYGALSGFIFGMVIYLQTTMGYSAVRAGASLLPVSILLLTLSSRSAGLAAKYGTRIFMTIGPLVVAGGMACLYRLHPGMSYLYDIFPGTILFGVGMALFVAPLTITVMSSVDQSDSGIASGINNAVSRAAGLIVIALLGIFGVAHTYRFTILLCMGLTCTAGLLSFLFIRNPARK